MENCVNDKKTSLAFIVFLSFIIFMIISSSSEKFIDNIGNSFAEFFEPNVQSVSVEAFGDQQYWNSDLPSRVYSTGPVVGGTQSAAFQLYQQAVNAATPTAAQLERASNLPGGGYEFVSTVPPSGNDTIYDAAAVDFGNRRAELISPCAQNAPTFVATSLLPKMNLPGVPSWDVVDTEALANQDFLSATQRIGVDTVLSSLRNPSYDIRSNIPNPINVVSPWNNSTITPDLERRPLDGFVPRDGIYGEPNIYAEPLGYMSRR